MTITITRTKLALSILALALVIPATAYATHVFDDVPDHAFYAEPVEWAFANGITTGKSPTEFAPLDNVTRGESVTFLQRYHENVADAPIPAFFAQVSTITVPGAEDDPIIFDQETLDIGDNFDTTTGVFTVPVTGIYQLTFVAAYESAGGVVQVLNGTDAIGATFASNGTSEDHTATEVLTIELEQGDEISVSRVNAPSLWGTTGFGPFTYITGHLIQAT